MNLRGYPGTDCDPDLPRRPARTTRATIPCFAEPRGTSRRTGSRRRSTPSTRTPTSGTCCYAWRHKRLAVHGVRARRAAAHLPQGRRATSSASSARSSSIQPRASTMRLTRGRCSRARRPARSAQPASTSSSTSSPAARRSAPRRRPAPAEQHLLEGVRIVDHESVEVLVPPLHHEVVTARRDRDARRPARRAGARSSTLLAGLEADYAPSPAGLGVTVAWGLPYFERLVPAAARRHLPHDRRASKPALARRAALPERSGGHAARGERRRDPAAQRRRATTSTTRSTGSRGARSVRRDRRSAAASRAAASTAAARCRSRWRSPPASPAPT